MVKNLPASAGDIRDMGSIPGPGRSPGGRHGNPLQYSCLESPKDRGARQVIVHRVAKTLRQQKQLSTSTRADNQEKETRYLSQKGRGKTPFSDGILHFENPKHSKKSLQKNQ